MSEASESSVQIITRASNATHAKIIKFALERKILKKENQALLPNVSEAARVIFEEFFAMKEGKT